MLRVSFDEATRLARKIRVLLDDRLDPLAERDRLKTEQAQEQALGITFRQCAEACIEAHRAGWKSVKHAAQWPSTLETYAYPILGNKAVSDIDVALVKKVIEPIWHTKNETAERVRSRLEKVLGWASVHGYRSGKNPARWAGYLSEVFPKRAAVRKIKHHPALPYAELPAFMRLLDRYRLATSAGGRHGNLVNIVNQRRKEPEMSVKVCKHGNSLSIRLGAHVTRLAQIRDGDYVSVRLLDSGDIQVRPVKGPIAANAQVGETPQPAPVKEQW